MTTTMMIVLTKHVDGADCCLISIILGVTMKKYRPIYNTITIQYLRNANITQYPITQYRVVF